jgi:hypothetical protein
MEGTDTTPSLDITGPNGPVMIEVDAARGVMYVHIEGFTVLRICRIKDAIWLEQTGKDSRQLK